MTRLRRLRNVGISAHIDSGKTTLTERMLYYCGRIHRMRDVKGNTVEVERSLRVLDGAVLVLCAVGGVQSQSLTVDRQMKRYEVPRMAFINKMDRAGANPEKVIAQLREKLKTNAVALQIPIGREDHFEGVVDLVAMRAVYFRGEHGESIERHEIPKNLKSAAETARGQMLDALSHLDDGLMETLLNDRVPGEDYIHRVIRLATISQRLTPVLMGSAQKDKGVQEVLTAIARYLPCPADRKVVANDTSTNVDQTDGRQVQLSTSSDDPLVAMAFKTVVESFGQLTFMRIYQGQMRRGETYVNARTNRSVRFSRLVRIHAGQRNDIDAADAGDIIGVVGVDCASGDTFLGDGVECSLENIFVPEPVIRLAIAAKSRDDAGKLAKALDGFRREDPTFRVSTDPQTGEILIAGMGQLHLDVYVEKLRRDHDCECVTGPPRVSWKQCPTRPVSFDHVYKKMTGGPGQFGHITGRMEPLPEDSTETFEFSDEVRGGRIPREYIPAVKHRQKS